MASNNQPDSQEKSESSKSGNSLPRGLLGKDGIPVSKSMRLPTLRPQKDLTLGGAARKSFKPTIPVRAKDRSQSG